MSRLPHHSVTEVSARDADEGLVLFGPMCCTALPADTQYLPGKEAECFFFALCLRLS